VNSVRHNEKILAVGQVRSAHDDGGGIRPLIRAKTLSNAWFWAKGDPVARLFAESVSWESRTYSRRGTHRQTDARSKTSQ